VHSKDFSSAPRTAQAEYVFFGGTRYSGMRAMIKLAFVWARLAKAMRAAHGYSGHYLWYRFPYTIGNFSFWATWDDMMAFARSDEHRKAMAWLAKPNVGKASFVRFLKAAPDGHTLGEWRAEPDPDQEWRRYRLPFSSGRVAGMEDWLGDGR